MSALSPLALISLLIVLVSVGPIFTIWALNALFGTGIAVNFWTWLSVVWLGGLIRTSAAD
jgi:hypothetical protein